MKKNISIKILISKTRSELKIDSDNKVFLNVARLSIGKGQLDLVRAFKKASINYPYIVLLLVGEGVLFKDLQNLIVGLELEEKVFLLGYRNDVDLMLHLADFFVFPSYFEGLSGALIEAIMSKTPCIISDIPENLECFPNDSNLNFEAGNVNQIAKRMEEALKISDWESKTTKAYRYAEENFDIKTVSKKYDLFYQKIISEKCSTDFKLICILNSYIVCRLAL